MRVLGFCELVTSECMVSLCYMQGNKCGVLAKVTEANNVLSRRLRRLPTYDEIAEMVNVDVSTVRLVYERNRSPISLDRSVTDRGCMTLKVVFLKSLLITWKKHSNIDKRNLIVHLYIYRYIY